MKVELTNEQVNEMLVLVRKRFPDWNSFDHKHFQEKEIIYKRKAVELASKLLDETDLRKLIAEGNYDEVVSRLGKVAQATNLLHLSTPAAGDLSILHTESLDKPSFCAAVLDLLYGEGPAHVRLDRFSAYCKERGLPNKWTFPTYYLFLLFPEEELFVKPSIVTWFMNFVGANKEYAAKPASPFYVWFKQVAGQLFILLQRFGAKDMIDIQSFIWVCASVTKDESITRYWKIAPGENAWLWDECRTGGFIAIGWDDLGDLTDLSEEELEQRYEEISARKPDWTTGGLTQVQKFLRIRPGDRIVANKGTTQVLGLGTVTGSYYFVPGVRHGHRLPVEWNDTTPRTVNQSGWRGTLIELSKKEFNEIASAPRVPDGIQPPEAKESPRARPYFTERTFELLSQLHANPTTMFYNEHHQEFEDHLQEPLRRLLADVAKELPKAIKDYVETEKGILAKIPKNDFGKGGTWDYLWGAFYPKGSRRIGDAQLYVTVKKESIEFGFAVTDYAPEVQQRLTQNCRTCGKELANILNHYDWGDYLQGDNQPADIARWLAEPDNYNFNVFQLIPAHEASDLPAKKLRTRIAQSFVQLFPLALLAGPENPWPAIRAYLGAEDSERESPEQPPYTRADFTGDTGISEAQLENWLQAIERKGQAILYGPPGTGKTFVAKRLAKLLVGDDDGFVELVQFHPAYAYEDFIQGIRPESKADGGLHYPVVPGRFLNFCQKAQMAKGKCVLIIDEINRANLARVFGELMYLLEYREEEIPMAGGGGLKIPANVRIIGTMNTADRSIALVDHALRRRFAFLPLYPQYEILERHHAQTGFPVQRLIEVLKELNNTIGDKHYHVGISFFLTKDLSSQLENIWRTEIQPYLDEYFFDRSEKAEAFSWERVKERISRG